MVWSVVQGPKEQTEPITKGEALLHTLLYTSIPTISLKNFKSVLNTEAESTDQGNVLSLVFKVLH